MKYTNILQRVGSCNRLSGMTKIFSLGFVLVIIPQLSPAVDLRTVLEPGLKISFQHFNIKKNKITGLSDFEYLNTKKDGIKFIQEKNANTKPNGKAFTAKEAFFDPETGDIREYHETDLRNGMDIVNMHEKQSIRTTLIKDGKTRSFSVEKEADMIPLEILNLYMRTLAQKIEKEGKLRILLYIPMLAIDLEDKGLPLSMAKLWMTVENKGTENLDTVLGKVEVMKVRVKPESAAINFLLDKSKSEFYFYMLKTPPYYVVQFEEGETQHQLTKLEKAKS